MLKQNPDLKLSDIDQAGIWCNVKVKVTKLIDPLYLPSSAMFQKGLVADQTDEIEFVVWLKGKHRPMREGKSYLLKSVVTTEYQGRFSISVNRASQIIDIEDLEL
jgi:replication factor A1